METVIVQFNTVYAAAPEVRSELCKVDMSQPLHHAVVRPERNLAVHHLLSAELCEQEKAVVTMTAVPTWLSRSPGAPRRLRQPGWKLFSRNTRIPARMLSWCSCELTRNCAG